MNVDEKVFENLEFVMQYHKEQQGLYFDDIVEKLGKCDYDTLRLIRAYVSILVEDKEMERNERTH